MTFTPLARRIQLNDRQIKILEQACELLSDKNNWCSKSHARTYRNDSCNPKSPDATQWSAAGAIELYSDDRVDMKLIEQCVGEYTPGFLGLMTISRHGYDEVMRVMRGTLSEQISLARGGNRRQEDPAHVG